MSVFLSLLLLASGVTLLAAWVAHLTPTVEDAVAEALATPLSHWDGLVPCQYPDCPARVAEPRDAIPDCGRHHPYDQLAIIKGDQS